MNQSKVNEIIDHCKHEKEKDQALTNLMVAVFGGEQITEGTSGAKLKFEGIVDKIKQLIDFNNKLDQRIAQVENTALAIARVSNIDADNVAQELFNEDGQYLWELNFKESLERIIRNKENEKASSDNSIENNQA